MFHIVWDLHKVLDIGTSVCASLDIETVTLLFKNKKSFTSINKNPTNNYKKIDNEALTRHRPAVVETDLVSSCWTNDVKIIVKLNNARKIAICSDDVNKLSTKGKTRHPSYAAACSTD